MALTYDILLRVVGGLAGVYLLLSLFNVHWLTRLRTLGAILVGLILVGWLGWPLVRPADPLGAICLVDGIVPPFNGLWLCAMGFAAGFAAYWTGYPKGLLTAPLAVPAGMSAWCFASGDMRTLLITNSTLVERQKVYAVLGWEGLFWLLPVIAGLLGVLAGWVLHKRQMPQLTISKLSDEGKPLYLLIAAVASVVVVQILISILAQDVRQQDPQLGQVVGQPGKGQVAFAVFVSFLAAGYAVKYFIKTSYIIPTLCAAIAVFLAMRYAASPAVAEQMTRNWAVAYFPRAVCAILPLQMVAFGALGAFAGFQSAKKVMESPKQA